MTAEEVIKTKVGLLELGKQLGNVSQGIYKTLLDELQTDPDTWLELGGNKQRLTTRPHPTIVRSGVDLYT